VEDGFLLTLRVPLLELSDGSDELSEEQHMVAKLTQEFLTSISSTVSGAIQRQRQRFREQRAQASNSRKPDPYVPFDTNFMLVDFLVAHPPYLICRAYIYIYIGCHDFP